MEVSTARITVIFIAWMSIPACLIAWGFQANDLRNPWLWLLMIGWFASAVSFCWMAKAHEASQAESYGGDATYRVVDESAGIIIDAWKEEA